MIELLDRMPRAVALGGKRSREFFTREGRLRHIHRLNHWPLDRVLREKYHLPREDVSGWCGECLHLDGPDTAAEGVRSWPAWASSRRLAVRKHTIRCIPLATPRG